MALNHRNIHSTARFDQPAPPKSANAIILEVLAAAGIPRSMRHGAAKPRDEGNPDQYKERPLASLHSRPKSSTYDSVLSDYVASLSPAERAVYVARVRRGLLG